MGALVVHVTAQAYLYLCFDVETGFLAPDINRIKYKHTKK